MALLNLGKKKAKKGGKKRTSLKRPKRNASVKSMQSYVEKRTKQLEEGIKKAELAQQVEALSKARVEDFVKTSTRSRVRF